MFVLAVVSKIPAMMRRLINGICILLLLIVMLTAVTHCRENNKKAADIPSSPVADTFWVGPDTSLIPATQEGELIKYGRSLIANTSFYLGPKGKIAHSSNGMNCQNCHLDAGTKPWGNNYSAVFATYPKFRERRGAIENVFQRINDCFERSLNGKALDSNSHEMQAMLAYMKWVGTNVQKGKKPAGSGLRQLAFLKREADKEKGKLVYEKQCVSCHAINGAGILKPGSATYLYPPLWGNNSYNTGAGLYRLSRFAGYIKDNMPFGATYQNNKLSNEEAWDVAAFVNSQPRPQNDFKKDWPDISLKPIDHPFGPYTDSFSEQQHKYGPFDPIKKMKDIAAAKKISHK
jgi:thiosulfate dehydrogenase